MTITRPAKHSGAYISRKGKTSINLLLACDARGNVIYANSNYPGGVNDAAILAHCDLGRNLQNIAPGYVFLGDKGFANNNFLLTPHRQPDTAGKRTFNTNHKKTRVVVEQVFGTMKKKFTILKTEMRLEPQRAAVTILAAVTLYQILMRLGDIKLRMYGPRKAVLRHPPANVPNMRTWISNNL